MLFSEKHSPATSESFSIGQKVLWPVQLLGVFLDAGPSAKPDMLAQILILCNAH